MVGRKLFGPIEGFVSLYRSFRDVRYLKNAKKKNLMNDTFQERIMLSITQVNGCPLCSYYHTQAALESGINEDEVKALLEGELHDAPKEEREALLFAQHYADSRSHYSKKAYEQILKEYGREKAQGILAAIEMITVGNTYGMPFGSLLSHFSRDKSKHDARSNLLYELLMIVTVVPFALVAFIAASLRNLVHSSSNV